MTSAPHYELKSELARWSMVSRRSQSDRRLGWANSVCLLFLFIGLVGAQTRQPIPKPVAPLEEAAPIIVEPLPPPPTEATRAPEQAEPEKNAAPVVVVVPNAPTVNFSVPTVGTLLAPATMAQAPPADELRVREPQPSAPTLLGNTGKFGERPEPPYPEMALKFGMQGAVGLLLKADAEGNILSADVEKSSGSGLLDRASKDYVTLHWKLPKGQAGHLFRVQITYLLTQ
jgi:TonB family protein